MKAQREIFIHKYPCCLISYNALYAAKTSMYVHICQRNVIGNMDTKLKRDIFLDDSNFTEELNPVV